MTRWSRLPEMYAAAGAFTWNTDTPAKTLDNMRVNLARGLKPLGPCKPHGEVISIAAGGPSLADGEMQGHVAAGNGSLGYLIDGASSRNSASSSTPCRTWPRSSSPTTVYTNCSRLAAITLARA